MANLSMDDKRKLLQSALDAINPVTGDFHASCWIQDVWDDRLVYERQSQMYEASYVIDAEGKVTFGEPKKVMRQTVYNAMESLRTAYADLVQEAYHRSQSATDSQRVKQVMASCQSQIAKPDAQIAKVLESATGELKWLREQAVMKTEDGVAYPASAFAHVPDKDKPGDWKLRIWEDAEKKATKAQLGRAAAALSPGGFRGQKAEIPNDDLPAVKRRIRAAYKALEVPDEEMPKWVKEAEMRDYIHESIIIPVAEASAENIAKGIVPVRILQPGFNTSKTRHYSESAVQDAVKIFEGAKQYANHATRTEEKERPERDIRDWVATLENVKVAANGNAVGEARIHAGWFKEMVTNLYEAGTLSKLGVSINSIGRGSRQAINGTQTFAVESLVDHPFKSVDFVTEAGAGGQCGVCESAAPEIVDAYIVSLAKLKEARPDLVKELETELQAKNTTEAKRTMEIAEELKQAKDRLAVLEAENLGLKTKITEADKARAKTEAQAAIKEAVQKSTLPDVARSRLVEQFKEAESVDGVEAAIKAEGDYLAKLNESGKVKGMGATTPDLSKLSPSEKIRLGTEQG